MIIFILSHFQVFQLIHFMNYLIHYLINYLTKKISMQVLTTKNKNNLIS